MLPLSLQARLLGLQPCPVPVAVDPKGFKSALQSFIQFLIAHEVSATLWVKLPKGDAWWEDIWAYGQQAAGCTIYTLGEQTGTPPDTLAASLRPIPIEQTAELKREYLCVAVADSFVGSLLAARVKSDTPTPDKRSLKLYCSAAGRTVEALSAGIKDIVKSSLPTPIVDELAESTAEAAAPMSGDARVIAGAAALSQWDRSFPAHVLGQNMLPLSEAFVSWQLQVQENLRSQLNDYRNSQGGEVGSESSAVSSTFLSQASQKLQAPLTTIKTALTLLGSPNLKLAQRQRYLEMISTQCGEQKALIKSIIELLKIQTTAPQTPQPVRLSDLIPGIVSTYQPIAEERGIMLAHTIPANLAAVSTVESELKQIVIQLINNGIQITPKDGRVWVSATPQAGDFVALIVQDSGSGIAKTEVNQLFEAFYQVPSGKSEGTGLGLTLVQHLVRRIGGSISVESTPNHGTSFKLLLPVHEGTRSAAIASRPTQQPEAAQRHHQHSAVSHEPSVSRAHSQVSAGAGRV